MNVIFPVDKEKLVYPRDFVDESEKPDILYRALAGKDAIVIPHHPSHPVGRGVSGVDWRYYDKRLTLLVEICSKHGVSEYFGCPDAIHDQASQGTVRKALELGHRLGFVGSTDSHASRPGSWGIPGDLWAQRGGITAVFADTLDRTSIYNALKARRCYATTGARIILDFAVNEAPMGSETTCNKGTERIVKGKVTGTESIDYLELIRNGEVIYRRKPFLGSSDRFKFAFTDKEPLTADTYYYVRVMQTDGHQAWASPIWVRVNR